MVDKMGLSFILTVCISMVLTLCVSANNVPVLFWGNKGVPSTPPIPAGHALSSEDFNHGFLGKLNDGSKHNFAVFLQKKLSLDDITQNADVYQSNSEGGAFHNLKDLMKRLPSGHLPRVNAAGDAISTWQDSFEGKVHDLKSPYNLGDLNLSEDASNLIVVHLPDIAASSDKVSPSLIDDVIGSVSKALAGYNKPYSAIYTASTSSKKPKEQLYFGRHLLQNAEASSYHFYNKSCLVMYAESIVVSINSSMTAEMAPTEDFEVTCGTNTTLKLVFQGNTSVPALTKVTMTLLFSNESAGYGYWELMSWTANFTESDTGASFAVKGIYAPIGHSYHCTDGKMYSKTPSVSVLATNLQLQAYTNPQSPFGRPNDCVGFFTIPILMGLIATFVLLSILTFGIVMLAGINTMDRYDDPKGKAITVNVMD